MPVDSVTGRHRRPGRPPTQQPRSRHGPRIPARSRRPGRPPPVPEINGRPVISRDDMTARGIGRSTVDAKYADRANTGHPEKAGRIGRTDYWYDDEWTAWFEQYRQKLRAGMTAVDRSGNANELVDAKEAARILNYSSGNVVTTNLRKGDFVAADGWEDLPNGKQSPRWKRSTIWAFADSRSGHGSPKTGTRRSRATQPKSAPYAADERVSTLRRRLSAGEQLRAEAIAAEFDVSTRTAERLLSAARAVDGA